MKRFISLLAAVAMATAWVGSTLTTWAQDENAPAASEKAPKKGTGPFNGKIAAVDVDASTVTIGQRTFKITPDTKVTNGSLAAAKVGDKTGGAFKTAEDGSLIATTIWFGSKPGSE